MFINLCCVCAGWSCDLPAVAEEYLPVWLGINNKVCVSFTFTIFIILNKKPACGFCHLVASYSIFIFPTFTPEKNKFCFSASFLLPWPPHPPPLLMIGYPLQVFHNSSYFWSISRGRSDTSHEWGEKKHLYVFIIVWSPPWEFSNDFNAIIFYMEHIRWIFRKWNACVT